MQALPYKNRKKAMRIPAHGLTAACVFHSFEQEGLAVSQHEEPPEG